MEAIAEIAAEAIGGIIEGAVELVSTIDLSNMFPAKEAKQTPSEDVGCDHDFQLVTMTKKPYMRCTRCGES